VVAVSFLFVLEVLQEISAQKNKAISKVKTILILINGDYFKLNFIL
jgi:hypothetical protein